MIKTKTLIKLIIICFIAVTIFYVYKESGIKDFFKFTNMEQFIDSYRKFAPLIFICIFIVRTLFVFFPYSIMVVLGGVLFGHLEGFVYSMVSAAASATAAFFISRYVCGSFVQRMVNKNKLYKRLGVERNGMKYIFFLRLSCLFPFDIVNYAIGVTKISFRDFIIGTVFGVIPEVFSLTYIGDNLENPTSFKMLIGIFVFILIVSIPRVYSRMKVVKSR